MKKLFYVLFLFLLLPAATYSQQWVNKFNYTGNSKYETGSFVFTDASANVYVVGNSLSGSPNTIPYDNDITVYKYNSAGTQQWTETYAGAVNGKDSVTKAVIDASGNIYLTGCSTINNTDSTEILTMMISAAGLTVWSKTYSLVAGSYHDIGNDIFVDGSGNVFVTGESEGVVILMKYNNSGTLQFAKYTLGDAGRGNSIYVDGSSNIYVAGSFPGGWGGDEIEMRKYNSSGNIVWTTGNGYGGQGTKILVDGSGNTFVAANNSNLSAYIYKINSSGSITGVLSEDYVTINDMELDAFGDVCVCGSSSPIALSYTFGIVQVYSNSLGVIWSANYTDVNSYITFNSMVVDNSFNVFVTGFYGAKTLTAKYNSSGVKQWGVSYVSAAGSAAANSIVIDNAGNPIIAGTNDNGGTGKDYLVVKLTSIGGNHWNRNINRLVSFSEVVTASKQDASGNYYLTGYVNLSNNVYGSQVGYGIIEKVNSSGTVVWSYIDTSYSNVRYNDLDFDVSGNIYITGTANENIITMKFSSTGTIVWSRTFNGSGAGYDEGTSIALDASGNIYLCGNSYKNATNYIDGVAVKYNSAGTFQWSQYLPTTNTFFYDHAIKIKIDGANNIIVGENTVNASQDINVAIYNPSGGFVTSFVIGGTAGGTDVLSDMALDAAGNIYITGSLAQSGTGNDLFVEKISSSTGPLWSSTYNSGGASNEKAFSLTTDKNGNVFACGYANTSGTNENILTVKYNSAGLFQWAKTIVNPSGGVNYANAVAADTNGNVFVTGRYLSSGYYNVIALKYNSLGNELVRLFYDGVGNGDCEGAEGFLNSTGDFVIAANAFESPQKQNIDLINFSRDNFAIKMKVVAGIEGLWNGTTQTRDSLMVYLRNSFAPYSKVDSAMAYLYNSCDDTVSFFSAPSASYYISVSHRNSLETWSSSTQPLSPGSYYIQNFTGNQSDAYGNNLIFYNSKWCIYSGDINKDGFINGNDFTQFSSQYGQSGYLAADLNNDGVVNGNDFTLYSTSFGKVTLHP